MPTWTADRILATTTQLTRIDNFLDTARNRIRARAYFSAAGALGAAALAKRDAMREFPPILVGETDTIPFLELYDLLRHLGEIMSFPRAHSMGHGDHPDVPPLDEIRRQLEEARRQLQSYADRDWMDDCGTRFSEAVEHLDKVLARLDRLDLSDQDDIESVLRKMDEFLACVSDEVNLKDAYNHLAFLDGCFEGDAKTLLKRPPQPRELEQVEWSFGVVEDTKHELIEWILGAASTPEQDGEPGSGAEDLPPIPEDHASRRGPRPEQGVVLAGRGRSGPLVIVADRDARLVDWPLPDPWNAPRPGERGPGRRRKGEGEDADDPGDEPPPVIYGEEIESPACNPMFLHGLDRLGCNPVLEQAAARCDGEIVGYIWPGSKWRANAAGAVTEINRTFDYFAGHCIHLTLRQLQIADKEERRMERLYRQWYEAMIQQIGGEQNLGRATIHFLRPFLDLMKALQETAERQGAKLLVVFIDEYLTDWRPTLGSANRRAFHQIGIDWTDSNSPYILAHEFVHAFGKANKKTPGRVTWNHNSPCGNALTTVGNRGRAPINLSGRFLERQEYDEIVANRGGNVLTARPL